ncbi:MAG: sporulation protein [Anaerophaga sp.]|uniref:SPOR domain-containing protein n=1 Tax=Anaerophaga thermohalophila TaxID=177400 RepID=UPI0002FA160B|nr:SPOR domain-containing protein [Anaerophaga thermohalophila]MBZ4675651.1 sporulation protein [Anaerophaga sp.]
MKRYSLAAVFLIVIIFAGIAQLPGGNLSSEADDIFDRLEKVEDDKGIISIEQPERMKNLVAIHIAMNKRSAGVEGFRVQLFSGVGSKARQEALEVKAKVLSEFPDEHIFIEYSAPFWRVRVGSFRHKHEALPLLEKLRKLFPSCYVVRTNDIPLSAFK